eukprot:CAMPEP_0181338402 /NCGR_PEP_ID=MMETSP1101-20121128/28616_1 /TAXON_ID=46948 /ORGANISM="Rhodomonas abbreviata, Strain Caron Lab Isolate" /LENGTH=177 /DNA_ID=CAMNT_0023449127 /DNA_START=18 /DNA_END=554 /DNA_ORIENTATION=+
MPPSQTSSALVSQLCEAAKCGNTSELRRLLALEEFTAATVNSGSHSKDGYTPLHYAAWNGMGVSAGLLVEAKANVNATDACGRAPLHFASRMGHTAVVAQLGQLGADVNIQQQLGATPLHYAAMEGHAATCQKLIKLGADVGSVNDAGSTPLAMAEAKDRDKVITYLKHAAKKKELQ